MREWVTKCDLFKWSLFVHLKNLMRRVSRQHDFVSKSNWFMDGGTTRDRQRLVLASEEGVTVTSNLLISLRLRFVLIPRPDQRQ